MRAARMHDTHPGVAWLKFAALRTPDWQPSRSNSRFSLISSSLTFFRVCA